LSQPGLKNNKRDRGQMSKAKPRRVDPRPPRKAVADKCEEQATHYEKNDAEMYHKDDIGQELIWHLDDVAYQFNVSFWSKILWCYQSCQFSMSS
jgi:hypothetical protein